MSRNLAELSNSEDEQKRSMGDSWKNNLRCACPGIILNFNPVEQTVTVQLALRELVKQYDYSKEWKEIPPLLDVPIVIPRAGGYCLTMPIKNGDECLVIFADMCIDSWWQSGGIQNQAELRRHDLSDGFAILGTWSQPRTIENYSMDSCQLRNKNGTSLIELKENEINLIAKNIKINGIDITPKDGD